MRKNYFLGFAANYSREDRWAQLFTVGRNEDCRDLENYLDRKYDGVKTILTKNGRSALTLALMNYFDEGDKILVNGFTCYAVYEAIKAAKLEPVFVDINLDDLNFDYNKLAEVLSKGAESSDSRANSSIKGIIVQNTFGNPVDIELVEKLAQEHGLVIIEDLAHSSGVKYKDGREAGTVGAAAVFSFGKDKSIDTISGGAVVFRSQYKGEVKAPTKLPKCSDHLRARFYPTFGALARALTYIRLGGALMRCLVKIHWVEKSADNRLDLEQKISKFEAKRALLQLKSLSRGGEKPIREFCFVNKRSELLKKLTNAGYYFGGFWYEKPVSPERYYQKVHFPEKDCENAVYAAEHIINLPVNYRKKNLDPARKIITEYLDK